MKKIMVSWKSQISKNLPPQYLNENSLKLNYTIKHIDFLEHELKNEHYLNNHLCSSKYQTVAEHEKNLHYHDVIFLVVIPVYQPYPQETFYRVISALPYPQHQHFENVLIYPTQTPYRRLLLYSQKL